LPPTAQGGIRVHATAPTLRSADPTVPDPLATAQVWPAGWVFTVTAYAVPLVSFVANANDPFADTGRLSPPLSCNTTLPPDNPDTDPPTPNVGTVIHQTATFATSAN